MRFLKVLTGKKSTTRPDKVDKQEKVTKKKKKKSNSSAPSVASTVSARLSGPDDFRTPNEQTAEDWVDCVNKHGSVDEMLQCFASPDAPMNFEDGQTMPAFVMSTEIRKCYLGFDDLSFSYASIKEVRPGEVLVEELLVTGTHTGDMQFANFPPIPPTGKHVVLDPERLWMTMKDGKTVSMEIVALGNLTGPPGMYMSVGGRLDVPPPQG